MRGEDGRLRLVAQNARGREVPVEALSNGTRDQLFLALRLATLAASLERSETMPLVADDILIEFDDERTRATLEVLAEFGERTQILLFSHHRHVAEQARALGRPRARRRAVMRDADGEPPAAAGAHPRDRLPRSLGLWDATMLIVASVVGSGIFFTPSQVVGLLPSAGPYLAVWVAGAAISLVGAFVNAELGAMYPRAGGNYVYLREAIHPAAGLPRGLAQLLRDLRGGRLRPSRSSSSSWSHRPSDSIARGVLVGASGLVVAVSIVNLP
jgi:hypothetical protein